MLILFIYLLLIIFLVNMLIIFLSLNHTQMLMASVKSFFLYSCA